MISDSRFVEWHESDSLQYEGEYVYFEFKGSEVTVREKLSITATGTQLQVSHSLNEQLEEKLETLLRETEFNIRFKDLKGKARFVKRLPPPNAKGKIDLGIRVNKKFFSRVGELED